MVRKSPAQLDRDIAQALARAPSSTATIDTTATLERKFRSRQRDALTLSEQARQARGAAARWMKRSSAHAREGEFRAADDAQTEAAALGRLASDLEMEVARIRTRSHATKKVEKRRTIRVDIGRGLKDGIGTAAAAFRLKALRDKGATDIVLARTGRLTFTRNGQRYEYRVTLPRDRSEADAFEAAGTIDSPLSRALADIGA